MSVQLAVVAILLVAVIFVVLGLRRFFSGEDVLDERLNEYATLPEIQRRVTSGKSNTWIKRLRVRLNATLSIFFSDDMTLQLMSADWPITATEYFLTRVGITAAGFVLGWLVSGSILGGLGLALLGYVIPGILLKRSVNKRRLAFERQLVDVLVLITGAVRAGFSLVQALEVVVREMKAPASDEFARVLQEVSLGRSLSQALTNLSFRMNNKDLDLLVTAVNIHYQVGGNLTVMLNSVTETIRERIRLYAEIRVLTTQQRYTAYILSLLPFIVAGILFFLNPTYMMGLFDKRIIFVPVLALVGIMAGFFIVRRLANVQI